MPDKKSGESEKSAEDKALEQRIDVMMSKDIPDDTRLSDISTSRPATVAHTPVKDQQTAPKLPTKLKVTDATSPVYKPKPIAQPPIVMALADEGKTGAVTAAAGPESAAEPKEADDPEAASTPLDDNATDEAVDDIVANESDKILAVDDALAAHKNRTNKRRGGSWKDRLRSLLKNKWTWVALVVLLGIIFAVPATRYKLLGLAIKKSVTITIIDSKNGTPVSSAEVQLAGDSVKTDANGQAHLRAGVGKHSVTIQKQYYATTTVPYFVGFKATTTSKIKLVATGRLVPITVLNTITGQPVSGAEVKVLNTTAKTNSKGQALVALPASANNDAATLSFAGYNTTDISIQVTDQVIKANTFKLTPSGHIYFLSNLSGNIDVVKANLDGSGRKTVLAGTGKEDQNSTSLLASRDWRFLVLKSHRDGAQAALYLIDTSDDKVTEFDNSNSSLTLIGWYGHNFMYDLVNLNAPQSQSGREIIKSYDADHLQPNQLDQNQAEGSGAGYGYQTFSSFYILSGLLAYTTQWNTYGVGFDLSGKTDTIRGVQPAGQNKKDYQSFAAGSTGSITAALYEPQGMYLAIYSNQNSSTTYYKFENQIASTTSDINQSDFYKTYPTFLLSPSGNQTFWTELRDGKNTLFTGDANAGSKKQIASLSDYAPYGWFSDNYVLVSKNSSELYIMPVGGLSGGQQPLKVSDYYKPAQTFNGYGYGYGGL